MINIRKSEHRGHVTHRWLDSYHTFSFASYRDPEFVQFRDLRVINEDRIAPSSGFPNHAHSDMEILTYVIEGELVHRDSLGNGSVVRPGEIQRMTAGSGITHSEFNGSSECTLHLLQIWILAEKNGLEPGYEQTNFLRFRKPNSLALIASRGGRGDSVHINQDVNLYSCELEPDQQILYRADPHRYAWIQVAKGEIEVDGQPASNGDGIAISDQDSITIGTTSGGEFLLFDLK